MKKLCGCNKACGCGDNVYPSHQPCVQGYPECAGVEECSESFKGQCLFYTGDTITNLDIQKGMSFNDIVQKLVLVTVNPACNYPGSSCMSVVGLYSTKITQTMATFTWGALSTNPSYRLEYRLPSSINWTANPDTLNTQDTIVGLSPNTEYYVKVTTICGVGQTCTSLILKIKTKPN